MDKWYIVSNNEIINTDESSIFIEYYKLKDIDNSVKNNKTKNKLLKKNTVNDKENDYWENFIKFESAWAL
jgi:hypothetical protein